MDEFENSLIADFISDRWALFVAFCAERGLDEEFAEGVMKKLEEE